MAWRLAKSLHTLRDQINQMAPGRDKSSDGAIGNEEHSSRTSDHNPNPEGVVCAIDLTHSPARGFDAGAFAETLRRSLDPRIKYVISNRRIFSSVVAPWVWRPYGGANAHRSHVHVSVMGQRKLYDDTTPWKLEAVTIPLPILRRQTNIVATVFDDELGAYGPIDHTKPCVSLPAPFPSPRPKVRGFGPRGSAVGSVEDKGPWYDGTVARPADRYWETGTRPRAETDPRTNKAGIDLNPRMAELLGVDGKDIIDWEFVE